jgi:hypothetical protein
MSWNYRVLAFKDPMHEVVFQIHEVYYKEDGSLRAYGTNPAIMLSEDLKGLRWAANQVKKALSKPVIWGGERFPETYE